MGPTGYREELSATGRTLRHDSLPEHVRYEDTGCELSPTCLRCPLAVCRFDQRGGVRRVRTTDRDHDLRRFFEDGESVDALAERYRITRRHVFRILAGK